MRNKLDSDFEPMPDEVAMAQLSYSNWERAEAESLAEFISRRRTVDLAYLVRQIIAEELSDVERQAVMLRYDEQLSVKEIAKRMKIGASVASRDLRRAEEKIHTHLKYVVQYQYNLKHNDFLPVVTRQAFVIYAARNRITDFSARLLQLRTAENLSLKSVACAVDILPKRLQDIEAGQAVPDALELLRLSAFYGVSADAILKGEYGCDHH